MLTDAQSVAVWQMLRLLPHSPPWQQFSSSTLSMSFVQNSAVHCYIWCSFHEPLKSSKSIWRQILLTTFNTGTQLYQDVPKLSILLWNHDHLRFGTLDKHLISHTNLSGNTSGYFEYVKTALLWLKSHTSLTFWLKLRSHQQQCRSNTVKCHKSNDSFDEVECCFDEVEHCFDVVAGVDGALGTWQLSVDVITRVYIKSLNNSKDSWNISKSYKGLIYYLFLFF